RSLSHSPASARSQAFRACASAVLPPISTVASPTPSATAPAVQTTARTNPMRPPPPKAYITSQPGAKDLPTGWRCQRPDPLSWRSFGRLESPFVTPEESYAAALAQARAMGPPPPGRGPLEAFRSEAVEWLARVPEPPLYPRTDDPARASAG